MNVECTLTLGLKKHELIYFLCFSTAGPSGSSSSGSSIGVSMSSSNVRLLSDQELKSLGEELAVDDKLKASETSALKLKYQEARDEIANLKDAAVYCLRKFVYFLLL